MSSQWAGRRIAITRPEEGELGVRLRALGAVVVHVPLIAVDEPVDGGAALRRALARLASFDWLVVTSANGARRVGLAARDHIGLRLAAVGPATAEALATAAGRAVDLVPTMARGEGLVAEFPRRPARVLLAQADRASRAVADGLAAMGHDLETVTAYRTVERRPTPDELAALTGCHVVALASGSAAKAYVGAVGRTAAPVVVAIGPVTADAARRLGIVVGHVATSPDTDALLRLLERVQP